MIPFLVPCLFVFIGYPSLEEETDILIDSFENISLVKIPF